MNRHLTETLQKLGLGLLILILWEAAARFGPWPELLFPGPGAVAKSLIEISLDGRLLKGMIRSLSRLLQGYALSVMVGIPLGLITARVSFFAKAVKPWILGLQALPSICWLPLALLWFGLSEAAILFVVVMGSLLAVAISAEDGVKAIQPQLLSAAATLGIRGPRFYLGVLIPAAFPGIVTGLKLGWSFAWRALMAGELLFVSGGLGQLLTFGRDLLDVPLVMAVMVAIVAIGVLTDRVVFRGLEIRVRQRWGLAHSR